ncbi:PREDICTED: putative nuclease HARBI1 [Acropora digitifera]|uniref:putative nuclease HARBI1 n=1 Tax=Acropora digitifera TaxID=70779 RepID=UPI00077A6BDF|nr:PREDICTED: putative nuclease HARBI1 [Acropora digitifera]
MGTGVLPTGNVFGRKVIDARKQVSIFLWCIANQETTRLVADRFDVTFSSVSRVVRRVTESVLALRNQYIKWPNGAQLRETMESFLTEGGFPGVVGAIDGSLIQIRAPEENPESYICRKKYHALQLQVVCDDNMMLLDAFTGWPGSVHDSRVLRNSLLFRSADQKFNGETHLLGDGGYPLLTVYPNVKGSWDLFNMCCFLFLWLITPFRDNGHLTDDQRKFNKTLSSLRQVIERTIGLLKGRWRKLLHIDHLDVTHATKLVMAACVMHNFCIIHDDFDESYFLPNDDDDDDNDVGTDDGRGPRLAQLKRNRLMNIVCH